MTTLPYWHVDAFANRPFAGNQAAVMPLASWLSDATLQAIGEEANRARTRTDSGEHRNSPRPSRRSPLLTCAP